MEKKVDIVVPIYNAYEYTVDCIKSVIKYTDLKNHRLLLINDKSPDEKIVPMLKEFAKENSELNIIVLENEENSGFVKTVNKGMKYSDENDVLLLNSDTEVTKNWLDKIVKCAYTNSHIATVTPLTNNGTIYSIPNFGVDNEIPENMSLEEYANLVEECSLKRYPEMSTANGFCMFIKRSALKEIGFFDDVTFEKGYGEENDFCYRAFEYGYTHVLCDDTFIYHKGTQSFTSARKEFVLSHMKLLKERYPNCVYRTDEFIAKNPIRDIQENIKINIKMYNKKRILYLIHEWEEDLSKLPGGTSMHLADLIRGQKEDNICFVLAPNKFDFSEFKLYMYHKEESSCIFTFKIDMGYSVIKYSNAEYKEMLNKIIKGFGINLVHVQHLIFHTFDIGDCIKENNVPGIITLHDLYMICPTINMIYEETYCNLAKEKDCSKCLKHRLNLKNNILSNWQKNVRELLGKFDEILVPSNNTKTLYSDVYKELDIKVIEHGLKLDEFKIEQINTNESKRDNKTFNIAFIGVMTIHKGSNILRKLIKANESSNNKINIHLFGNSEDPKLLKDRPGYTYHGRYVREKLPSLLKENNIDLICIFSIWPETFSYTLSEAFIAKVPVITYNIGAVSERVQRDNLGYIVDYKTTPEEILKRISEIADDTEEYKKIVSNFDKVELKTLEKMLVEYKILYSKYLENSNINVIDYMDIVHFKNRNVFNEFDNYKNTYGHLVHKYETLRRTKTWRVAKSIKKKLRERLAK